MIGLLPSILSTIPSQGTTDVVSTLTPLAILAHVVFNGVILVRCVEEGLEYIIEGGDGRHLKSIIMMAAGGCALNYCADFFAMVTGYPIPTLW